MITYVIRSHLGKAKRFKYVRDQKVENGEEQLGPAKQSIEPEYISLGDEVAYKGSLLSERIVKPKNVY